MSSILEHRRTQYRAIYESLNTCERIKVKELSSTLGVNRHTTSKRLKEAFEQGYILMPQIRKRSYTNLREYMYFANCEDTLESYITYSKDMNVVYHAVMSGFANIWVISTKKLAIECDVILEGYRSDYHVAYAPHRSWEKTMQVMRKKVKEFNPEEYEPKRCIKTHWDEPIEWDSEDETLYQEFKYNVRKPLTPIMKNNLISGQKIYEFLQRLPECCTVFTKYFPETISAYDPYLFMFETDYEDFIVDLFSELPTSSMFFKVADKLFLSVHMKKDSIRKVGLDMADIAQLWIPLLVGDLKNKGILTKEAHAIVEYHWGKER